MEIGKVIGSVWATKKDEKLNGQKLLVLKLLSAPGILKEDMIVACDIVGAGTGDYVLISRGTAARLASGNQSAPVDAAVVGIVDSIEVDENE